MFKIFTAVFILVTSYSSFAFDSNASLVANLVRTELWYNGVKNSNNANQPNLQKVELSEELEVALEKFDR